MTAGIWDVFHFNLQEKAGKIFTLEARDSITQLPECFLHCELTMIIVLLQCVISCVHLSLHEAQ